MSCWRGSHRVVPARPRLRRSLASPRCPRRPLRSRNRPRTPPGRDPWWCRRVRGRPRHSPATASLSRRDAPGGPGWIREPCPAAPRPCPEAPPPRRAAPPAARSARPCSRLRSRPASLLREDARHGVEGGKVAEQTLDAQLALHQLHRDASPDLVVVDRPPEQADLEVAQVHDRAGLSANREIALGLEAVVDDKRSLAEVERHALVDVRDPDPDPGTEGVEILDRKSVV